jgi:MATE family multidrug resistance protein
MAEAPRPVTHGRVLKIAIPIVISNATVPILGAVDTGVVGQLGLAAPIGAVGLGAIILTGVYWVFGFLRMGTTGLTGQALGAGQGGEVAALLTRALMIGLGRFSRRRFLSPPPAPRSRGWRAITWPSASGPRPR